MVRPKNSCTALCIASTNQLMVSGLCVITTPLPTMSNMSWAYASHYRAHSTTAWLNNYQNTFLKGLNNSTRKPVLIIKRTRPNDKINTQSCPRNTYNVSSWEQRYQRNGSNHSKKHALLEEGRLRQTSQRQKRNIYLCLFPKVLKQAIIEHVACVVFALPDRCKGPEPGYTFRARQFVQCPASDSQKPPTARRRSSNREKPEALDPAKKRCSRKGDY